jgi:hypothetical protein
MKHSSALVVVAGLLSGLTSAAWASPFTGPTSPYYLDNYVTETIYEVQGTSVVNSFAWAYDPSCDNACEGMLAVTNVISTTWFGTGSASGSPGTAGQYTLGGTPTGTSWTDTPSPAGETVTNSYDGTTDGKNNYTVEWDNNLSTEVVIKTNLDWQNPTVLFTLCSSCIGTYIGIAYDPDNNSLWISGSGTDTIADYSLTGTLLSSFTTGTGGMDALAFDPADGTLWWTLYFAYDEGFNLYQYSTSGTLLQEGWPSGLPSERGYFSGDFAVTPPTTGVPEPACLALLGAALAGFGAVRRRKRNAA